MTIRTTMMLGAAFIAGSIASAGAADLYGGSSKDGYAPMQVSGPASWYVRGDVGYAWHDDPSMVEASRNDLTGATIDDTWTIGGGIGRYFSQSVRGDITYDHRFEADASGSRVVGPRTFGITSDVVLANLYYDFDRGSRFSPYIGIGLGAAFNRTNKGTAIGCVCAGGDIEEGDKWSVAGALMTGVTWNFGRRESYGGSIKDAPVYEGPSRWHVDAGYRYLYLGDASTGNIVNATASPGIDVKDIWAHEFRLGVRYDIR